jgi:hypothetical protein
MIDVQTDHHFWSFFSIRNRLYVVSDAPKLKNAAITQHATMAVIFQRAVRDE